MTSQRNKVHHIYTAGLLAKRLGVDEHLINELAIGLEPEDGVIWVYGLEDDDGITAFTDEGVEEIRLILEEYKAASSPKV
jgi:hypothetical protein